MAIPGMLGKLAPHPEDTHPRVKLADHLIPSKLPPVPAVVDYASKVGMWPKYMNDTIGDCTCAGIAHTIQAWTAYSKGLVTLPVNAVLSLYEAMGYVPGNPATDKGAIEHDVLNYVQRVGIGGHKILTYAQVDHKNPDEMKAALYLFGSVYLGASMPQSALDQTGTGQPWSVLTGSPIVGGHCFVLQRWDVAQAPMDVVTWGQLQRMTIEWWMDYGDEAWVMVSDDWLQSNGRTITGVDLVGLGDQFSVITDQLNPFRAEKARSHHFLGMIDHFMTKWFDTGRHAG